MKALQGFLLAILFVSLSAGVGFYAARSIERSRTESQPGPEPELDEEVPPRREVFDPSAAPAPREVGAVRESSSLNAKWAAKNKLAIAALEAGELERAVELFAACHEALPEEDVFRRNLAESLVRLAVRDHERLRPCSTCLGQVERALELTPTREDLKVLVDHWRRESEAEKDFWRESSLHFDLAYDGSRDELLFGSSSILSELESAYTDMVDVFGRAFVDEGRPKISVVLYRRESFDALTGLGDWAGGAFDGTVRVPVEDLAAEGAKLERVLRHELVHAFVREFGGPSVPGWLNEGLAQWLEGEARVSVANAREDLHGRELFGLDTLQGSLATWKDPDAIALAYAESLVLCDYIAKNYGDSLLFRMIEGCKTDIAPAQTFEQLTRVPLAVVLSDLEDEL